MFRVRVIVFAVVAAALLLPGVARAQFTGIIREDYFANANTSGAPEATLRINNAGAGAFTTQ